MDTHLDERVEAQIYLQDKHTYKMWDKKNEDHREKLVQPTQPDTYKQYPCSRAAGMSEEKDRFVFSIHFSDRRPTNIGQSWIYAPTSTCAVQHYDPLITSGYKYFTTTELAGMSVNNNNHPQ